MIFIENIYYMLSYAFRILNSQGYQDVATEGFDNATELCAAILIKGITFQLKHGLGKEYISQEETLTALRGRMDISASIKDMSIMRGRVVCNYDDCSVNSYMNRIIKSTMLLLLRSDITKARKKELRGLLVYFNEVDTIDIHLINWNQQYHRNNQTYRMLIAICYLIINSLLQTQSDGSTRLMDFFDEKHMCLLYEKFILNYYRYEWPQISCNAAQIPWQIDNNEKSFLPIMQSDVMLSYQDKILIIDAKYYSQTMQIHFETPKIRSAHLYQIFTYVKNKSAELIKNGEDQKEVSGLLLYAKTDEKIFPENTYKMSGNRIAVQTLDLNQKFPLIKKQLNIIAEEYLGVE